MSEPELNPLPPSIGPGAPADPRTDTADAPPRWRPPPPRPAEPGALEAPLRVIHADARLIVIDKPAGLLCVPGRGPEGADCLAQRVVARYPTALVVHRLDMATSGLVLMAGDAAMQRWLGLAFERRRMHKRYEAVVAGLLQADAGEIDQPMVVDWPRRPLQKICPVEGRPALTRWRVLARDPVRGTTRVALEPVTGRSHQLRLHMASIGHPILGDELYAPDPWVEAAPRLLLHACHLRLPPLPPLPETPPSPPRPDTPPAETGTGADTASGPVFDCPAPF
ncbi:RluA family pseudouridine synthase [Pseudaquabacterium rugosum]|uniref:Dual-specificity RNA pseudouridine synthase RluA n=1 Tax=Pseudaquabacterium rugosum TaxID=2984194 RepID=A0ABU9B762_9BURK